MHKKPSVGIDLDRLVGEALENIKTDRAAAWSLLVDIQKEILKNSEKHEKMGFVAAKYLEGLQRSSEQLIKLLSALSVKVTPSGPSGLSADDKDEVLNELQEEFNSELENSEKKKDG